MKKYISPEISFRLFSKDEVITASVVETPEKDPNAPVELPFVPAQ